MLLWFGSSTPREAEILALQRMRKKMIKNGKTFGESPVAKTIVFAIYVSICFNKISSIHVFTCASKAEPKQNQNSVAVLLTVSGPKVTFSLSLNSPAMF